MIILDTNVVSEVMRPRPDRLVLEWLDARNSEDFYLSAVTCAEIRYGLQSLPDGKRKAALEERFRFFLNRGFIGRILPFDEEAAGFYGDVMAERRSFGRPMSVLDGQIAAIARARLFAVATRNVKDFTDCGIRVLNPFGGETLQ